MTEDVEEKRKIDIPLQWREIRLSGNIYFPWHRQAAKYPRDRDQLNGPQVYKWILKDENGQEERSYIGESEAFQNRLASYRSPKISPAKTEKVVRDAIEECEKRGGSVELWLLDIDAGCFYLNGMLVNRYSLGDRDVRIMLESIATIEARQRDAKLINRLGDNAYKRGILGLLQEISRKKGIEFASTLLTDCLARIRAS
jgi:hypothetical protein